MGMVQMQDEEPRNCFGEHAIKSVRNHYHAYYRERVEAFKDAFRKVRGCGLPGGRELCRKIVGVF